MRRDLFLFLFWIVVIGLCLNYGRRVAPWFTGQAGLWAGAGLGLAGLAALAWGIALVGNMAPDVRLKAALGLAGAALGLGVLAWAQPLLIERTHLLLYGVLGVLAYRLCGHWLKGGRRLWAAVLVCALLGGLDEVGQYLHPQRVGEPRDALTNAAAAALVIWAVWVLDRPRSKV